MNTVQVSPANSGFRARANSKFGNTPGSATADLSGKACNANNIHWA